uniref:Ferredoxin n=1 Tax=Taenioma perpusillum TaxID=210852 RepID=A0A1Z1MR54_9FLOR|nr:ferredoxin [Taenioma perpusillum]ARW68570.1 ferredoxin [Taenioma perpusillum]
MVNNYVITLKHPEGESSTVECKDTDYILEAADEKGIDLPSSCRAGACSTCVGILEAGEVDQEEQSFLDDDQIKEGYILTCISIPLSDCTILTHQEDNLY